jgi:hypothetical protein
MDFNGCKLYIKWNYRRTDHCGYCSDPDEESTTTGKLCMLKNIPSFITCIDDLKNKRNDLIKKFKLEDRHCCWNGNNKYGTFNSNISFKIISSEEVPVYKVVVREFDDCEEEDYESDDSE